MESTSAYSPANDLISPQYNAGNIAVTALGLSMAYSPVSMQLPQQMLQPEDPPETLHMPWGIWLHKRDALHSIHQRYDTAHMIRTTRVAEDILHYAHYVPIVEGPDHDNLHEHETITYASKFEYNSAEGPNVYNMETAFGDKKHLKSLPVKTMRLAKGKQLEGENVSGIAKKLENAELDETPTINFSVNPESNKINDRPQNSPELEARIITIIIEQIVSLRLFNVKN